VGRDQQQEISVPEQRRQKIAEKIAAVLYWVIRSPQGQESAQGFLHMIREAIHDRLETEILKTKWEELFSYHGEIDTTHSIDELSSKTIAYLKTFFSLTSAHIHIIPPDASSPIVYSAPQQETISDPVIQQGLLQCKTTQTLIRITTSDRQLEIIFIPAVMENKLQGIVQVERRGKHIQLEEYGMLQTIISSLFLRIHMIQKNELIERTSIIDFDTGLYNKRFLEKQLHTAITNLGRNAERTFSLVIMDIDNFKDINDTRGHIAGDKVLKKIAQIIQQAIRETDTAFRYGGDEFVLLVEGDQCSQDKVIKRLHTGMKDIGITCSGGACLITNKHQKEFSSMIDTEKVYNVLIDFVDKEHMYKAKAISREKRALAPLNTCEVSRGTWDLENIIHMIEQ
jgi:diguanylate cyclase (GGDEF)-like protein